MHPSIWATVLSCPFAYVLIVATQNGLCHLKISDTPPTLPKNAKNDPLPLWTTPLTHYLNGNAPWPLLPFHIPNPTPFQNLVWQWLYTIPHGKTYSYSHVAQAIGSPSSARAVGGACAANPVPIVIPCHRITPKAGGIGQYNPHPFYKQKLLQLENAL